MCHRFIAFLSTCAALLSFVVNAHATGERPKVQTTFDAAEAMVPGSPPSGAHPMGTVLLYGAEALDDDRSRVVCVETDLATGADITRATVDELEGHVEGLNAHRDGDTIFLAVALNGTYGGDVPLVLFALDATQRITNRLEMSGFIHTAGELSVVADARWILVGAFESFREPVIEPIGADALQPTSVFHVRAIDRSTFTIASARVFRGEQLLMPGIIERHALAIAGDRAIVGLPQLGKVKVQSVTLPALADVDSVVLAAPQQPSPNFLLRADGARIEVEMEQERVELDGRLRVTRRRDGSFRSPIWFLRVGPRSVALDRPLYRGDPDEHVFLVR